MRIKFIIKELFHLHITIIHKDCKDEQEDKSEKEKEI